MSITFMLMRDDDEPERVWLPFVKYGKESFVRYLSSYPTIWAWKKCLVFLGVVVTVLAWCLHASEIFECNAVWGF